MMGYGEMVDCLGGLHWLGWLVGWLARFFITLSYLDPICKKLFYSSTLFLSFFFSILKRRQCFLTELSLKRLTYCFPNFNHSLSEKDKLI